MTEKLTGSMLVERMTEKERHIARRVESVLPPLREAAVRADAEGQFRRENIAVLREARLFGLIVPEEFGGLGGTLRDLTAAAFALGTACPSTALSFFFHCSSASRGLLGLEAIDAGLFDETDALAVRAFSARLLLKMGSEGRFLANFASEEAKSSASAVLISTTAAPAPGGWLLNGTKSFGCSTGVADEYLVQARVAEASGLDGLAFFFVPSAAAGVSERAQWDAIGMRATATHGIVLKDVFVPAADALTVPGAFLKMMQMSRGSYVGNQLAVVAVYLGIAHNVYEYAIRYLSGLKFGDTGKPIVAESAFHQELIGRMAVDLETGFLWARRQLELETSDPPLLPKEEVVRHWRLCKGVVCEAAHNVAVSALKACGTSNTGNSGVIARGLRDLTMGLVQAFPAERGRIEAAKSIVAGAMQSQFAVVN